MALYAESALAKGQAQLKKKWQQPETRRPIPTVMELALRNQEISIPNALELRKSPLRTVEIYYPKNIAPGVGTTKAALHTGGIGDSGKAEVTYVTHVETFSLPRKIAQNNTMSYETMFTNQYEQAWSNLRTRHNASALAYLYARRVQLSAAVMNPQIAAANPGTWNEVAYALEIAQENKKLFAEKGKTAMSSRFFNGEYDVIGDLQIASMLAQYANQGSSNAENTSWQFGGISIAQSQITIDSSYVNGSSLWLPKGMFAGLNWNDPLNLKGVQEGATVGMLGTIKDPMGSGAIADISMYTDRADTSANATGGSTQDILDEYELALCIGYITPPVSAAGDSVVHEIVMAA